MRQTTIQVMLIAPSGKRHVATVTIEEWDKRERLWRGLKVFGLCWGGAILAAFIPLLHFILVPLLVIAGPAIGYHFYQQDRMMRGGQSTCPDCGASLKVEKGPARWPAEEMCTACRTMLTVDRS